MAFEGFRGAGGPDIGQALVRIGADITGLREAGKVGASQLRAQLEAGLNGMGVGSMRGLTAEMAGVRAGARGLGGDLDYVGQRATLAGTAVKLALVSAASAAVSFAGLAVNAARNFEQAWANVEINVRGTKTQLADLRGEFDALSERIPVSTEALAGLAAQAGQFGVPIGQIKEFTETVAQLGLATAVSAQQATSALGPLRQTLQLGNGDIARFGATLTELGRSSGAGASSILTIATQVATAGKAIGLSNQQLLAFSATAGALGLPVEQSSTALYRFFTVVNAGMNGKNGLKEVADQAGVTTDELSRLADVTTKKGKAAFDDIATRAGMTSTELSKLVKGAGSFSEVAKNLGLDMTAFSAMWHGDPGQALLEIISSLNKLQGSQRTRVMSELGLGDIRSGRLLGALAERPDLLAKNLGLAGDAWKENTALTSAAATQTATFNSQMQLLMNTLQQGAVALGNLFLPHLKDLLGILTTQVPAAFSAIGDLWTRVLAGPFGKLMDAIGKFASALASALFGFGGDNTKSGQIKGVFSDLASSAALLATQLTNVLSVLTAIVSNPIVQGLGKIVTMVVAAGAVFTAARGIAGWLRGIGGAALSAVTLGHYGGGGAVAETAESRALVGAAGAHERAAAALTSAAGHLTAAGQREAAVASEERVRLGALGQWAPGLGMAMPDVSKGAEMVLPGSGQTYGLSYEAYLRAQRLQAAMQSRNYAALSKALGFRYVPGETDVWAKGNIFNVGEQTYTTADLQERLANNFPIDYGASMGGYGALPITQRARTAAARNALGEAGLSPEYVKSLTAAEARGLHTSLMTGDTAKFAALERDAQMAGTTILTRTMSNLRESISGSRVAGMWNSVKSGIGGAFSLVSKAFWPLFIADMVMSVAEQPIGDFIKNTLGHSRLGERFAKDWIGGTLDILAVMFGKPEGLVGRDGPQGTIKLPNDANGNPQEITGIDAGALDKFGLTADQLNSAVSDLDKIGKGNIVGMQGTVALYRTLSQAAAASMPYDLGDSVSPDSPNYNIPGLSPTDPMTKQLIEMARSLKAVPEDVLTALSKGPSGDVTEAMWQAQLEGVRQKVLAELKRRVDAGQTAISDALQQATDAIGLNVPGYRLQRLSDDQQQRLYGAATGMPDGGAGVARWYARTAIFGGMTGITTGAQAGGAPQALTANVGDLAKNIDAFSKALEQLDMSPAYEPSAAFATTFGNAGENWQTMSEDERKKVLQDYGFSASDLGTPEQLQAATDEFFQNLTVAYKASGYDQRAQLSDSTAAIVKQALIDGMTVPEIKQLMGPAWNNLFDGIGTLDGDVKMRLTKVVGDEMADIIKNANTDAAKTAAIQQWNRITGAGVAGVGANGEYPRAFLESYLGTIYKTRAESAGMLKAPADRQKAMGDLFTEVSGQFPQIKTWNDFMTYMLPGYRDEFNSAKTAGTMPDFIKKMQSMFGMGTRFTEKDLSSMIFGGTQPSNLATPGSALQPSQWSPGMVVSKAIQPSQWAPGMIQSALSAWPSEAGDMGDKSGTAFAVRFLHAIQTYMPNIAGAFGPPAPVNEPSQWSPYFVPPGPGSYGPPAPPAPPQWSPYFVPHAAGASFTARRPTAMIVGEAGNEEIAVLRNPRDVLGGLMATIGAALQRTVSGARRTAPSFAASMAGLGARSARAPMPSYAYAGGGGGSGRMAQPPIVASNPTFNRSMNQNIHVDEMTVLGPQDEFSLAKQFDFMAGGR